MRPTWASILLLASLPLFAAESSSDSFALLLRRVATPEGVRWSQFGADEKKLLSSYLDWVAATNPVTLGNRNDQLAFWVNAHNACVMKFVSERLPLDNVMTIDGFRDRLKCRIAGADYSLVDIESNVIRPLFGEPRVHFVLWWGVRGGARLGTTPYVGKELEASLEHASRKAVADPLFVRFERGKEKPLTLSPIFDWYKSDFGAKETDLLTFIRTRLPKEEAKKVPGTLAKVSFGPLDWTLDDVR